MFPILLSTNNDMSDFKKTIKEKFKAKKSWSPSIRSLIEHIELTCAFNIEVIDKLISDVEKAIVNLGSWSNSNFMVKKGPEL